ncbi:S8 family serine peptidase [Sutcliffiella horikoshii]|uniref:S8 family serine peptidase n=1 Tax=Sutcliffiella horikoshii TaxID=79883 RepID=UPI002958B483|nr:S8 family serine peptidase [Sutcliffiella horikoshii]UAL46432.1 S8 family serine peptidase [Sutcliffiella horikoshii]
MKKKVFKKATTLALATGLMFSAFAPVNNPLNVHAETPSSINQVLTNLTPAQREALNKLQISDQSGLQLTPEVNLESDDKVSVIVEFKDKPAKTAVVEEAAKGKKVSLADAEQKADAAHETFKKDLQSIYQEDVKKKKDFYKIKRSYKHSLNGVSMELPSNKVEALLQSKVVKAVWSNETVQVEPPVEQKSSDNTTETKRLTFPGVDQLHHEGLTGKGIKVGVIDTGIDYNHPDLKDAYKGGYDFVDNDNDPMETTYDDWKKSGYAEINPLTGSTYYTQHGTHVAGIIAGQGKNNADYAVTGVAPEADIYAYRVLGQYGSGSTEAILAAIDRAVLDGMDVINLSLGRSYNDPLYVTSMALNHAVMAGVTSVVSAGNSGDSMYTLGSPGTAALAITVGASDTPETIETSKGTLEDVTADLKLLAKSLDDKVEELKGHSLPIIYAGFGAASDFNNKDVNGKIVLVDRGILTLDAKIKEAQKHGAKAVLMANNIQGEGFIPSYLGEGYGMIPTFSLSYEQGTMLKQKANGTSEFSFDEIGEVVTEGNKLASFSSRGPARTTYDIKPEVIAPGVSVFSTVPSYMHGEDQIGNYQYAYKRLSGTSMASPNVAGVAALLLQANPDFTPEQVKQVLMNTADPLNGEYSVYEVGAGVVNPYEAIHSQSRIEVSDETQGQLDKKGNYKMVKDKTGAISFGTFAPDGTNLTDQRSLTIYNNSKQAKTFDVNIEFQVLEGRFQNDYRTSNDADANGVQISTDKKVKVNGNGKKKTNVFITIPKTAALGTYEGYITYTNQVNPEETYQVPFAIRTTKEGIEFVEILNKEITTTKDYNAARRYTDVYLNLTSHMRTLDVFLVDGKTNEELGFIGTYDGMLMNEKVDLGIKHVFEGYYYPFTGDVDKPIAYNPKLAKQGSYKLKFVGTNDSGKAFSKESTIYIESIAPELDLNIKEDVYEYTTEETTINVTGSIFDKETEDMKAAGFDVSQGSNEMFYHDQLGGRPVQIPVNEDGTFSVDIPINQTRPMQLWFYGRDAASNQTWNNSRMIYFIREGEPHANMQAEKIFANMGESVQTTLTLDNVKNVREAVYTLVQYNTTLTEPIVTSHSSVSDAVDIKVEDQKVFGDYNKLIVTVTTKEGMPALSGDLSLANIEFKMKDDNYSQAPIFYARYMTASYTDTNNEKKEALSANPMIFVKTTYSMVYGPVAAEAFMNPSGTPNLKDYKKAGVKVQATGKDDKVYLGKFASQSTGYDIPHLPLTDEEFQFELDVPGHFTVHNTFNVGFHDDGKVTSQRKYLPYKTAIAGDVNKDDVIDVMDAVYIQTHWGTNKREADINYDGIVDEKDIAFVVNNYSMQNPTIQNAPKPKKNYKGQTLEKILNELNIQ